MRPASSTLELKAHQQGRFSFQAVRAIASFRRRDGVEFSGPWLHGAEQCFDYALPPSAFPWLPRIFYRRVLERLAAHGEPWKSFFVPGPLRADLTQIGFTHIDDLGGAEINARYLSGRRDGLKAGSVGRIVVARR